MERSSKRVVLTTCRRWPEISASDALLAAELDRRGHEVQILPWNVAPIHDFVAADAVVLRSNWDFHHEFDDFGAWLDTLEAAGVRLHNPIELVRPHLDKSYLLRLAPLGLPAPRMRVAEQGDVSGIAAWMEENRLDDAVIKPMWGASGHGVERIRAGEVALGLGQRSPDDGRPLLVQEFIPEIARGEYALVFFGGTYSHALLRRPADNDFRVNGQYGGSMRLADEVDPVMIDVGQRVLSTFSTTATYARIDLVGGFGDPVTLMEVEVNEPALGLDLAPGSAERFADAICSEG